MPQPRKYKTNAERQAAYRDRKRSAEASQPGAAVVARVMKADKAARGQG